MRLNARNPQNSMARIVTSTAYLLSTFLFSSGLAVAATQRNGPSQQASDLTFLSPQFGSLQSSPQVKVSLQYATDDEDSTLKLKLNGKVVSDRLFTKSCNGSACTISGKVTLWDGLREGENLLSATLTTRSPLSATVKRLTFDYFGGVGGTTVNRIEPASVGFKTVSPGGGNPWIEIDTGSTLGVEDPIAGLPPVENDNNTPQTLTGTFSVPYADAQFGTTCTSSLQAIALIRATPSEMEGTACGEGVSDIQSSFQSSLGRSLNSGDLIVLGTTQGHTIPADLDTTPFGGTKYPPIAFKVIQGYMMVGVPGSPAGSALESTTVAPTPYHPYSYQPSLNGTLTQDPNGYYQFEPSEEQNFQVVSDGANSSITIGSTKYTPPDAASWIDNFWLLIVDRESLQPVNYIIGGVHTLNCTDSNKTCGGIYDVKSDNGAALANELQQLSSHDLFFLVSLGCPFDRSDQVGVPLSQAVAITGGFSYSLQSLNPNANACAYSLVSSNDGQHTNPLTDNLALSANYLAAQNQLGAVNGMLSRNKGGLYDVSDKAQMYLDNKSQSLASGVEYTFQQIVSGQRQDWALTDSTNDLMVYYDISHQLLRDSSIKQTGSHLYDIRYFYTEPNIAAEFDNLIDSRLSPTGTNPVKQSSWDTATADQFAAGVRAMAAEIQQYHSATTFLLGTNGVQGIIDNSGQNSFGTMGTMAAAIIADESQAASAAGSWNTSSFLNELAGTLSVFSIIPGAGPIVGVVSGGLHLAADFTVEDSNGNPLSSYDILLNKLDADATSYVANLTEGFNSAVSNILTDSHKLQTVGNLASNSDSGWSVNPFTTDQKIALASKMATGAQVSLWQDIFPQLYGIRYYLNGRPSSPLDYTSTNYAFDTCMSVYANATPNSWESFADFGHPTSYDVFVFAESPKGSTSDTTVSSTLIDYLTTSKSVPIGGSMQVGLNLPRTILYANSNMTYSPLQFYSNLYCSR